MDYVLDHVPKKLGLEDVRKYTFRGMTPSQRIAAIASIVAERAKGELYVELENDDNNSVQPPKLDGDEIVVGAAFFAVPYTSSRVGTGYTPRLCVSSLKSSLRRNDRTSAYQ